MCRYTSPQRHPLLGEKQVMIDMQYHKGQPQPGHSKDDICSLRNAIEDLLLDYIPYLLHLHQLSLRQCATGALIPP